jgi:membrane protease YdiL (CAAX protease family)
MNNFRPKYYPTTLEAVHLLVLYLFLQALVDFRLPLRLSARYRLAVKALDQFYLQCINYCFHFLFGYRKAKAPFRQVFALAPFSPFLLIAVLILLPGLQYLVSFINVAVERAIPSPPWFWELFDSVFNNRFGFWGSVFRVAVFAPVVEETFFRGILMFGLMRNYKSGYAIFLSAIMFSLFHLNPWQMTYTFFLGLFLAWLMVRTRSLPLCILAHAANNLIVLLSIRYTNEISTSF